ncbi:MAG: hypothetical protein ACHREM_03795 [Polyangiales bacterium]
MRTYRIQLVRRVVRAAVVLASIAVTSSCKSQPSPTRAFAITDDFTACAADSECMIVSLGCCHETPVRRDHEVETRKRLQESGLQYCSPKDACGPSRNGTWDGEPAVCKAGKCAKPEGGRGR